MFHPRLLLAPALLAAATAASAHTGAGAHLHAGDGAMQALMAGLSHPIAGLTICWPWWRWACGAG
jgi:urease accessory protein